MQVKLDLNASARIGATEARPSRSAPSGTDREDELVLSEAQSLVRAAGTDGSVRPEKVAQAREALKGSKYPPTEVIDQISRLLAIQTTAVAH